MKQCILNNKFELIKLKNILSIKFNKLYYK